MTDLWTYRDYEWGSSNTDIAAYTVQAIDGEIGNVDEATYEVGASYIVVDVGPWMVGKKVLLPAVVIERVDLADERVYVNCTKDEVRNAPEFDEDHYREESYRMAIGNYYGPGGPAYRQHDSPLADPLLPGKPQIGASK